MAQNSIVLTTKLEQFVVKINKERDIVDKSCQLERLQEECEKSIVSVYHFMLKGLGMPERSISFDEYKMVNDEMREIARQFTARKLNWFFRPRKTWHWAYYLKYGTFRIRNKNWQGYFYGHSPLTSFISESGGTHIHNPSNLYNLADELMKKRYSSDEIASY